MTEQELWETVSEDVVLRLERVAYLINDKIAERAIKDNIRDTGQFADSFTYKIDYDAQGYTLLFWNRARHSNYVLGGSQYWKKLPALKPILAWVERKKLAWVDDDGNKKTALQMAFMIRSKIFRDGLPERNVFQDVVREEMDWIESELQKVFN